jgi:hypothetical protein
MPSRLIKDENGMCAGADFSGDLVEVLGVLFAGSIAQLPSEKTLIESPRRKFASFRGK